MIRYRRLRQASWIRSLSEETTLQPRNLILPLFIREADDPEFFSPFFSLGRVKIPDLLKVVEKAHHLGILSIALFPYINSSKKTEDGKEALNPDNLMCRALRYLKDQKCPLGLIADVALDPYTTHGHDGILQNGEVLNDETVEILTKQALLLAEAGADVIAPSDMMDGRIQAIRTILEKNGHKNTLILSYAAKYASYYYGPFRSAVGVKALQGLSDKKTYQMSFFNREEALKEVRQDVIEGADMVMIKPALPYLDVIYQVKKENPALPVLAYQVSGEYAALKAAAEQGIFKFEDALLENLIALRRAGATSILTYGALEMAEVLLKRRI